MPPGMPRWACGSHSSPGGTRTARDPHKRNAQRRILCFSSSHASASHLKWQERGTIEGLSQDHPESQNRKKLKCSADNFISDGYTGHSDIPVLSQGEKHTGLPRVGSAALPYRVVTRDTPDCVCPSQGSRAIGAHSHLDAAVPRTSRPARERPAAGILQRTATLRPTV